MKGFRFSVSLLLSLLLAPSLVLAATPQLVAKVGTVPISRFELQREAERCIPASLRFHGGLTDAKWAQIRSEALGHLIDQALKTSYAQDQKLSVTDAEIDLRLKDVFEKFPTQEAIDKALGEESYADFRAAIGRELLANKAEKMGVDDVVRVSDDGLRNYYQAHKEKYRQPRTFQASHILVKVDPTLVGEEREALHKKAEDLAKRAQAGEDFYNLAYYNSDDGSKWVGGSLGTFHEGQSAPELDAALLKMKPGEISDPVASMYGFHIIRLEAVQDPRQLSFEDVKENIRKDLEDEKRQARYDEWLAGLRAKYSVERFYDPLQQ